MSTSINPDHNDPYFIPSVPTYTENLGAENDDTLGDEFFERLSLNDNTAGENHVVTTPKMQPRQRSMRSSVLKQQQNSAIPPASNSKATALSKADIPKVQAQPRPLRRSMMTGPRPSNTSTSMSAANSTSNKPNVVQPPARNLRKSVMPAATQSLEEKKPVPKVQAQPRPIRRSTFTGPRPQDQGTAAVTQDAITTGKKTTIIQPPMRFGNIPTRRCAIPAKPHVSASTAASTPSCSKSTIVQPPMRFGNIPTSTRRSMMPAESSSTGRGKIADVSHAVQGISVQRFSSRIREQKQKEQK